MPVPDMYNAQGDREAAKDWGTLLRALPKMLNPMNYYEALGAATDAGRNEEILPRSKFVGPPAASDQPAVPAEMLPMLGNVSEYGVPPGETAKSAPFPGRGDAREVFPGRKLEVNDWDRVAPATATAPVKARARSKGKGPAQPAGPSTPTASGTVANPTEQVEDDKDIKALKGWIDKFESNKKLDLSPLLALADSWAGSNLKAGYNRPLSDEEREQAVLKLRSFAAEKEADMRYKKAYLNSMQQQDATRLAIKDKELASRERIAGINASSRMATANTQSKLQGRLRKDNQNSLLEIARLNGSGNPKDKTYKNMVDVYHHDANDMAEAMLEDPDSGINDYGLAYQTAVNAMMATAKAGEANRQKQKQEE